MTLKQSSAVHIPALYSADVILLGFCSLTSAFSYKFSFSSGQTVGQFPNCTKPRTLCAICGPTCFMEYTCRKGLKVYKFVLGDDSIFVSSRGFLDSEEYEIPFESIGDRKVVGVYASDSAFVVAVFSILFSFILVSFDNLQAFAIFGLIGVVSLLYGFITRQGIVTISKFYGGNLELYFGNSTKAEAVAFAESTISMARSFIKQKYSNFDRQMPLEKQFENLEYLKERNLLSIEEYNQVKDYLLGNEKRSIGFYQ